MPIIYSDSINPFVYQTMEPIEMPQKPIKNQLIGINFRKITADNPKMV